MFTVYGWLGALLFLNIGVHCKTRRGVYVKRVWWKLWLIWVKNEVKMALFVKREEERRKGTKL